MVRSKNYTFLGPTSYRLCWYGMRIGQSIKKEKKKRNAIAIRFLKQIIGDRLLPVVIAEVKK